MIRLHGYWAAGAPYRIRIALNLKGLEWESVSHDLRHGEQKSPEYLTLNPQGLVPALEADGQVITQSLAIMEWLDETYPEPPLLPGDKDARAKVRTMAAVIACDIHPLNNLRVLNAIRGDFNADEDQVLTWTGRWITQGFDALEAMLGQYGGAWAYGDMPGMADCCIIPQVFSARRFKVDLAPYPRIVALAERAASHPAFAAAAPEKQEKPA